MAWYTDKVQEVNLKTPSSFLCDVFLSVLEPVFVSVSFQRGRALLLAECAEGEPGERALFG